MKYILIGCSCILPKNIEAVKTIILIVLLYAALLLIDDDYLSINYMPIQTKNYKVVLQPNLKCEQIVSGRKLGTITNQDRFFNIL